MSTTSDTSSYCQCQKKDMMEELNRTLSLMDAAEYMIKHKHPVTDENISIFMNVATQAYLIRLEIMKMLIQ